MVVVVRVSCGSVSRDRNEVCSARVTPCLARKSGAVEVKAGVGAERVRTVYG